MPVAGTIETYQMNVVDSESHDPMREDLSDIIYNISPTETPFMMMIGRGTATNTRHEWNTDRLLTVDEDNAVPEGDDVTTFPSTVQSYRIDNICQISRKLVIVAGTAEVVDKAGRKSELAYQLAKRAKELKRDMESVLIAGRTDPLTTAPQGKTPASSNANRYLAPYETWMTDGSNDNTSPVEWVGSEQPQNISGTATATTDGFQPTDGAQRVDGTARAFAEADLKDVIKQVWDQGGDATVIMTGSFNKQAASAFSGNTTRFDRSEDMRLVTAVDIYVSDFGEHRIVPNRFSRDRSVLVITPSMWSVDYLRGFRQFPLAKTGDAEKRELLVEYTLRASNPHASGIVADLTVA